MGCQCFKSGPPDDGAAARYGDKGACTEAVRSIADAPGAEGPAREPSIPAAVETPRSGGAQAPLAEVSAWAWGAGPAFGESQPVLTPVQLPVKGRSLRGLGTAWEQTLLVASSGALWAAGANGDRCLFEELPAGPQPAGAVDLPELEGRQVEAAAGGRAHIVTVLEDGNRVLSWGRSNEFGQLGHGTSSSSRVGPRAVALPAPRARVRQVACGEFHTLVLTVTGAVYAFGDGSKGALGLGALSAAPQPAPVDTGQLRALPVRAVAAGAQHSLALCAAGSVLAWGCGAHGQLGLGPNTEEVVATPRRVPPFPEPAALIAAGGRHTAVVLQSGRCLLAGDNEHGQLGRSPAQLRGSPSFVDVAGTWRAVALGSSHSLLLGHDGRVYACGRNDQGQLGGGQAADAPVPGLAQVRLPPALSVVALAAGPEHSLVLAARGPHTADVAQPEARDRLHGPPKQQEILAAGGTPPPRAWPGVCATANFAGMDVSDLQQLAKAAAAAPSSAKVGEDVMQQLGTVLANPPLLNASFCFPGVAQLHLDTDGLVQAFEALWRSGAVTEQLEAQLHGAAIQGLDRWGGDPKTWVDAPPPLTHRDQVRGLAVLLLCPLVGDPEQSAEAYTLTGRLLGLIAALSQEGRTAFVSVIVDDMVSVLRTELVLRVRRFCNAAIRRCVAGKRFDLTLWASLLVLDTLAWANAAVQRRKQCELPVHLAGLGAAADMQLTLSKTFSGRLTRTLSNLGAAAGGGAAAGDPNGGPAFRSFFWVPEAPVPAEDFELEALAEGVVPAEVEFQLFLQNAKAKVLETKEVLGLRPHDERLHSFTVHRQLLPAAFLRRVLSVENMYRQSLQQQQGFQDMILRALAGEIQLSPDGGLASVDQSKFFFPINVRREHLLEDTLQVLQDAAPADLQKQLRVTFRGEEGQDAGGVSREFFRLLGQELFVLQSKLFDKAVAEEARVLWLDQASPREPLDFWMLGVVLGLAVYNSLPGVDARFPVCLFKKLRGEPLSLEDLGEVRPSVASSFRALLAWKPEGDLAPIAASELFKSTFCLDFSITWEDQGQQRCEELKTGGKDLPVTLDNRAEFVRLYCDWELNRSVARQFEPFKKGFGRVCESPLLQALTGAELARIVMGESDTALERLRPKAIYSGFAEGSPVIDWLWAVLQGFDAMQRRLFLNFVTGSDRAPVGGLGELQLTIQKAPGDARRLPSAHTCFNTLLLPEYTSQQQLRDSLLAAIENTEGFGLE